MYDLFLILVFDVRAPANRTTSARRTLSLVDTVLFYHRTTLCAVLEFRGSTPAQVTPA